MLRAVCLSLVALPPLAACAPLPVDQAERLCVEEANQARRPARARATGHHPARMLGKPGAGEARLLGALDRHRRTGRDEGDGRQEGGPRLHQYTRFRGAIFARSMPPSASVVSGSRWTGR